MTQEHGGAADVDQELASARKWLDQLDLPHAAVHVAQAIAADPARPEPYAELDRMPTAELFPLAEDSYIGNVAARAYLDAREGKWARTFAYVTMCLAVEPDRSWTGAPWWAWLDSVEPSALGSALAEAAPTFRRASDKTALHPFLELARRLIDAEPGNIELAVRLSTAADGLGATAEGASWCTHAASLAHGPLGQILLGYALRDAGRFTEMEAAWTRAVEADPSNVDVRVALATSLIEREQSAQGRRWLDEALTIDPHHAGARALNHALRYQKSGRAEHLIAIVDEARTGGHADACREILMLSCARRTWLHYIPMPTESIVSLLNHVVKARRDGQEMKLTRTAMTAVEPPSAVAAAMACLPGLDVHVLDCPAPDLRVPLRDGVHRVWSYGVSPSPSPAMAPPSEEACDLLRRVGDLPWTSPMDAYERATAFGALSLDDLLGLLCHMPSHPDNDRWNKAIADAAYWPRLAAGWACLGILHQEAEQLWAVSTRRQVLVDLAFGVEDWVSDSALFALVVAAWMDPAARADVRTLVSDRFAAARKAARRRACTIAPSIAELVMITPEVTVADMRRARRLLSADANPPRTLIGHAVAQLRNRFGR